MDDDELVNLARELREMVADLTAEAGRLYEPDPPSPGTNPERAERVAAELQAQAEAQAGFVDIEEGGELPGYVADIVVDDPPSPGVHPAEAERVAADLYAQNIGNAGAADEDVDGGDDPVFYDRRGNPIHFDPERVRITGFTLTINTNKPPPRPDAPIPFDGAAADQDALLEVLREIVWGREGDFELTTACVRTWFATRPEGETEVKTARVEHVVAEWNRRNNIPYRLHAHAIVHVAHTGYMVPRVSSEQLHAQLDPELRARFLIGPGRSHIQMSFFVRQNKAQNYTLKYVPGSYVEDGAYVFNSSLVPIPPVSPQIYAG